nr:hypothetical protein [Candidatus Freyrarchaeum guaymaensis]
MRSRSSFRAADGRQVEDPELGLAHNLGGPASVASVTILGRT